MRKLRAVMRLIAALRNKYDELLSGAFFTRDYRGLTQYSIGEYTYGLPRVLFPQSGSELIIGRFCSIARDVTIMLGGEHNLDWVTTYPFHNILPGAPPVTGNPPSKRGVTIGSDVWLGRGALILAGVDIGHGAVVGAGSVVTRSLPPYAIAAGNPARILRYRLPPEQIEALLEIQWWNWELERIREALPLMLSAGVEAFIENCQLSEVRLQGASRRNHSV